jgi:DNA-binding HxlR family transcriptional regulator
MITMEKKCKTNEKISCPIRGILDRFGDKWSMLVIILLGQNEVLRFNQLNTLIGDISQKMLTVTLRTLETDGLVTRKIYAEIPPRVEYSLTPIGKELLPLISNLTEWALRHKAAIEQSRAIFDTNLQIN